MLGSIELLNNQATLRFQRTRDRDVIAQVLRVVGIEPHSGAVGGLVIPERGCTNATSYCGGGPSDGMALYGRSGFVKLMQNGSITVSTENEALFGIIERVIADV
jgi:hypothetical protein